jgi:hypothetical protein
VWVTLLPFLSLPFLPPLPLSFLLLLFLPVVLFRW